MHEDGWKIYFHPAFEQVRQKLIEDVLTLKDKDPISYKKHPKTKFLKKIDDLIFKEIPLDPANENYLQGNTLGSKHRHWRRAKLFKRFRLFFRFHSEHKIIIYAWLNDTNSLRKAGSKNDPYNLFVKRLKNGNPPGTWDDLLKESSVPTNLLL